MKGKLKVGDWVVVRNFDESAKVREIIGSYFLADFLIEDDIDECGIGSFSDLLPIFCIDKVFTNEGIIEELEEKYKKIQSCRSCGFA